MAEYPDLKFTGLKPGNDWIHGQLLWAGVFQLENGEKKIFPYYVNLHFTAAITLEKLERALHLGKLKAQKMMDEATLEKRLPVDNEPRQVVSVSWITWEAFLKFAPDAESWLAFQNQTKTSIVAEKEIEHV